MTSCRTNGICAPVRVLLIASGLTAGLSLAEAAEAIAAGDSLLSPTPLILKDGRIANVSVHVVAFAQGGSVLDSALAQQLSVLTDEVATDCFLTAQVIGHVGSSEVAGNDTLTAHRLARARADTVQATLIAGGLPAKAIASVWDWQFMVREARATLWVFRLTPGEDCEGEPLDSSAAPLVAQAESPATPPQSPQVPAAGTTAAVAAEVARPQAPALAAGLAAKPAIAETAPPPVAAVPAGPSPAPAQVPSVTQALPAISPADVPPPARAAETRTAEAKPAEVKPLATRAAAAEPATTERAAAKPTAVKPAEAPAAAPAPAERAADQPTDVKPAEIRTAAAAPAPAERTAAKPTDVKPAETRTAAAAPAATERAAAKPTEVKAVDAKAAETRPETKDVAAMPGRSDRAAVAAAQPEPAQGQAAVDVKEERLVIVFPTNSSYFPPGTGSQLRSLLRTLAQDRRYEVVLESSVSGSQKVVGAENAEDAAKYNKWLATRRLDRVREWLDQNAAGKGLTIKPEYHANDESRQVVVRIRPTG